MALLTTPVCDYCRHTILDGDYVNENGKVSCFPCAFTEEQLSHLLDRAKEVDRKQQIRFSVTGAMFPP